MLKEKKNQIVEKLAKELSRGRIIISTNYQGLTAKQMAELRKTLVKAGAQYHVIKNTLTCFAAEKAGKAQIATTIDGPTALAFGYNDGVELVQALSQYIKSTGLPLQIRGGLLGDRILSSEEVLSLASLPSRQVLISQLVNRLEAPLRNLHSILSAPLQGLFIVLQRRIETIHAAEAGGLPKNS